MNPLEYLYYAGHTLHKRYGLLRQKRLQGRVISVGNLTVGGSGKTPVVMAIAEEAVKRGIRSCILTRGYKGSSRDPLIVSRGKGPIVSWKNAGDEPFLMAERLRDVWVIKDHLRYRGGLLSEKSDLFILDDGFQHWQLYRDTDILVIDATNPFGNGRLIPFGILREPVEGIKRADIILINKCDKKGFLEETVRRYNKNAPLFYSTYRLEGLLSLNGEIRPVETIRNRNVFAFSGIASPAYFLDSLKATGTSIKGSISFIDHHKYSEGDILKIQKLSARHGADFILTTEKDMVKLREIPLAGELRGLLSLRISLEVNDSEFYNIIFGREGGKG